MKKYFWLYVVIVVCIAIGGYIFILNSTKDGIKHVDNILGLQQTNNAANENNDKLTSNNSNMTQATTQDIDELVDKSIDKERETTQNQTSESTNDISGNTSQEVQSDKDLPSTDGIPGNSNSNYAFGGPIATDGLWEYFLCSFEPGDLSDGALYKMHSDGTNAQKLTDDYGGSLNVVGDWIYYIKWFDNQSQGIYRIKKDKTQYEKIFSGGCAGLIAVNDLLYFTNKLDGDKLYRIKTDGSNPECLVNGECYQIQYENGFLFYTNNSNLFRINIYKPSETEMITSNIFLYTIYNDTIYYLPNDTRNILVKKAIGSDESKIVNHKIIYPFFIVDERIYFMSEKQSSIYSMNLDGNNITEIPEGKYQPIRRIRAVVGDMVYYWAIFDSSEASMDKLARISTDGSINELIPDKVGY